MADTAIAPMLSTAAGANPNQSEPAAWCAGHFEDLRSAPDRCLEGFRFRGRPTDQKMRTLLAHVRRNP